MTAGLNSHSLAKSEEKTRVFLLPLQDSVFSGELGELGLRGLELDSAYGCVRGVR